jgi:peptidoglycan/LPS O-acetylase OafA/YrhL
MDALRASSMLLLVPAHAAGLLNGNGHDGAWAVAVFWVIHVFRLPLFFAMSGFFLALLIGRRGLAGTARNRTLRIVIPLGVGLLTLVPLLVAASKATGIVIAGDGEPTSGSAFHLQPSFLWFLWDLLIIDAVAVSAYLLAPRLLGLGGRAIRASVAHPAVGMALLAVPTAAALWTQPNWTAAPGTENFAPSPWTLAYYALFFALGATLCRHRELVAAARESAWRWAACAVAAAVPAALLFTLHNSPQLGDRPLVHASALLIYAIATWTSLIALVGLASRHLDRPRPRLRYLADSSYWIYLSHLTPMVLLIALLGGSGLGTAAQFLLVTLGSLAFSLATYPLLVRHTPIGLVLNGRRPRARRPWWRSPLAAPRAPTRPAAAAGRPT